MADALHTRRCFEEGALKALYAQGPYPGRTSHPSLMGAPAALRAPADAKGTPREPNFRDASPAPSAEHPMDDACLRLSPRSVSHSLGDGTNNREPPHNVIPPYSHTLKMMLLVLFTLSRVLRLTGIYTRPILPPYSHPYARPILSPQ
eukprot:1190949-Prorocentrum_minimum.AAC.2